MKNIIILLLSCSLLFLAFGCSKDKQSDQADSKASSKPDKEIHIFGPAGTTLPESGKELSTVAGVSIRRRPSSDSDTFASSGVDAKGVIRAINTPLSIIVRMLCRYGVPVFDNAPLPDGLYDVTAKASADNQPAGPLLKEAIEKAFDVRISQTNQLEDVHILVRQKGKSVTMSLSDPKAPNGYGTEHISGHLGYWFKNSPMDDLAGVLEKYTETPVFDETGLEGGYDFELAMDHWKPKTAFAAVEKLGLKLVKQKRKMEVLRIEKATEKDEHE